MILLDTSIWIDHLRCGDPRLTELLDHSQIMAHPFVIGELACGYLLDILTALKDGDSRHHTSRTRSCQQTPMGL